MICDGASLRLYCRWMGLLSGTLDNGAERPPPECLPPEVSFSTYASREFGRDTAPVTFVILILCLGPIILLFDAVVLKTLIRRIRSGQWAFIHQVTIVSFYTLLLCVGTMHLMLSPLDKTHNAGCLFPALLDAYEASDGLIWGCLYSGAFILTGTSLLRLIIYTRAPPLGLSNSGEAALAAIINICGYGVGITFGFLGDKPGGVVVKGGAEWKWARSEYPANLLEVFCHEIHGNYTPQTAANFAWADGFCVREIGRGLSRGVIYCFYDSAAIISVAIAAGLTWRFRHKLGDQSSLLQTLQPELWVRLRQERILVLVLTGEAVLALVQAIMATTSNACWHGMLKGLNCDQLDLGVYVVVFAQIIASLPLFLGLSARLRRETLAAFLPNKIFRRIYPAPMDENADTQHLVPAIEEERAEGEELGRIQPTTPTTTN